MAKKKVCIDAGHYGYYNPCPNNSAYYESKVMWKLHLLQKKYLEQLGIEVITTREDQSKDLGLTARGQKAKGCDLFISDHSNAVGNSMNETVDHVVIYHQTNDKNTKVDDVSKDFASKIAKVITDVMGVKQPYRLEARLSDSDRNGDGTKNDNYYAVLHGARMVGVAGMIIEHGFHTHSKTVEWLLNDNNLDKLARAEAECIASYLLGKTVSLNKEEETKKEEPKKEVIYRVQCGAFSIKAYAEGRLNEVKKIVPDAFIVKQDGYYKVQCGAFSVKAYADARLKEVKKYFSDAFITTK